MPNASCCAARSATAFARCAIGATASSPPRPTRTRRTREPSASGTSAPGATGMATRGSFSGPTAEVDVLLRALEPLAKARCDEARKADEREPYDAYRFDALVTLAENGGGGAAAPPVARVRVDLPALLAGGTSPGEVCEIPGVGSGPGQPREEGALARAPGAGDHRRRRRPHRRLHHPPRPGSAEDRDRRARRALQDPRLRPHPQPGATPHHGVRRAPAHHLRACSAGCAVPTTTSSPTTVTRSSTTATAPGRSGPRPRSAIPAWVNEIPTRRDTPPRQVCPGTRPARPWCRGIRRGRTQRGAGRRPLRAVPGEPRLGAGTLAAVLRGRAVERQR